MNVQDFTYLLQNPEKVVTPIQTKQLEDVLEEYPYFQAARALQLKGLRNLNSFKYNSALKTTAAYTTDRDILFDFITSKDFLQNSIANSISGKISPSLEHNVTSEEAESVHKEGIPLIETSKDKPLPQDLEDANQILNPKLFKSKDPKIDKALVKEKKKAKKELEIGKPLPFTKHEKHSFSEWLQLASYKTVQRDPSPKKEIVSDTNIDPS